MYASCGLAYSGRLMETLRREWQEMENGSIAVRKSESLDDYFS